MHFFLLLIAPTLIGLTVAVWNCSILVKKLKHKLCLNSEGKYDWSGKNKCLNRKHFKEGSWVILYIHLFPQKNLNPTFYIKNIAIQLYSRSKVEHSTGCDNKYYLPGYPCNQFVHCNKCVTNNTYNKTNDFLNKYKYNV